MAAALPPLVLTGASGFVGRHFVESLRSSDLGVARDVTLLVRQPASVHGQVPPHWRVLAVDLAAGGFPPGAIPRGSVVVHLAAATGRLAPAVMRAVNVEGTRHLLDAARDSGAAHVIFVSSIAARFSDRRWYHYAEAKIAAERLVVDSGVPYTIVRPTMVFGVGSPVQEGLERLAAGGAPIVLGRGDVMVQPVHVDDLVTLLRSLADAPPPSGATLDVGGGTRSTLRALLARMRADRALPPRDPWSVPLGIPRLMLGILEPLLGTRLPVTAGQLASFVNDSDAAPNELVRQRLPAPRALAGYEDASAAAAVLTREFAVFSRYLGVAHPPQRSTAAYLRGHPTATEIPADTLDSRLVGLARRSTTWCALADAYARLVRPYGALRRKLVLSVAVLESSPVTHADFDTARPSTALVAWGALVATGSAWLLRTACAVVVFAPVHLAAAMTTIPGGAARAKGASDG